MQRVQNVVGSRGFLFACFFVFLLNAACFKVSDVDVGFHIRTGELILATHQIPSENTFSYTHEHHPWLLHQWLPTILIYTIDKIGGYHAIILATMALAATMFAFVAAAGMHRRSSPAWLVFFLTLGLMAARFRFNIRPDLFSGLYFAILVWHLAKVKSGAKPSAWLIIGLMVVWANSHAGYVYGLILLGLFCAGEVLSIRVLGVAALLRSADSLRAAGDSRFTEARLHRLSSLRRLAGFSALGLALSVISVWLINPNGPHVLLLPFQFFTDQYYMSIIAEYARANVTQYPWFYSLMALGGVGLLLRWRQVDWSDVLPFVAFAWLGCAAVRNILFFVLVAVPIAAATWEPIGKSIRDHFSGLGRTFHPSAMNLLLLCGMVWCFGTRILPDTVYQYGLGLHRGFYPMAAFQLLGSRSITGNVFNEMQWGGPILWWVHPPRKVFIDGRLEAYEESFWKNTYEPLYFGDTAWEETFARYDINAALVHYGYNMPKEKMLAHRLAESKDWALVSWTEQSLLFLRRISAQEGLIRSNEFTAINPLARNLDYITPQNAPHVLRETERMLRGGEVFTTVWVLTGRACLVLGDYGRAAAAYEEALRGFLPPPLARRDLAFAYVQLRRFDEAGKLLRDLPHDEVNDALRKQIREARAGHSL